MQGRSRRPPRRRDLAGPRFDPIPKPGGGIRWLTRLDPADETGYRAAVGPLVERIERSLGPEVFAVRARPAIGGWTLRPWRPARAAWRRTLRAAMRSARRGSTFAVADVRDCYGSITVGTIEALLGPEAANAAAVLGDLETRGVRGLPIGPDPSAVLANAVLAHLDGALRSAGVRHARWVDDIILWGVAADVRHGLEALRRRAAVLGLDLHDGKTRILSDRREGDAVALGERDSSIIAAP